MPTDVRFVPIWDGCFNPLIGCEPKSTGCYSCYSALAAFMRARRHDGQCGPYTRDLTQMVGPWKQAQWTGIIRYYPERVRKFLEKPASPSGIIAGCTTSDLFAEGVPTDVIDEIMAAMMLCHRNTFFITTKRPERMESYAKRAMSLGGDHWQALASQWMPGESIYPGFPLRNLWIGPSVENNEWLAARAPFLEAAKMIAGIATLACEPLLEHLELGPHLTGPAKPDWVVISGEHSCGRAAYSRKSSRRPCVQWWIEEMIATCHAHGVPVFVRQLGNYFWYGPKGDEWRLKFKCIRGDDMTEWPETIRVRDLPLVAESLLFSEPKAHEKRQQEEITGPDRKFSNPLPPQRHKGQDHTE